MIDLHPGPRGDRQGDRADHTDDPEPVRRTSEIEDVTNLYFIHPIANRLTPVLRDLHVVPNAVSLAGMLFGVMAALAYWRYRDPWWAAAGFILMIAWHVMDGADGQLARLTQSQSQLGKILDGICDYVTFTAVYASLGLNLSRQYGNLVWVPVVVAGVCHAVQAAAYEAQRQEYEFWGLDRKSKRLLEPTRLPRDAASMRLSDRLERLYGRVQLLAIGSTISFHEQLERVLTSHPAHDAFIRKRYRALFAKPVRHWSIMSANYKTLGIFICSIAKIPLAYFIIEIFGFSIVLALLNHRQHLRYAAFLSSLVTADQLDEAPS